MKRFIRKGFTLIELLVVIAIIAMLIALLLPAIQQAREAARRAQCQSNFKNIGLAVHNYQSAFGYFPTSLMHPDPFGSLSWMAMILPYMDQQPVYDRLNFQTASNQLCPSFPASQQANSSAVNTVIASFVCPSDPFNDPKNCLAQFSRGGQVSTNYAGCQNAGSLNAASVRNNGTFSYWSDLETYPSTDARFQPYALSRKPKDFIDGMAQTIYAMEIRCRAPGPYADGEPSEPAPNGNRFTWTYASWFMNVPVYYVTYNDCLWGDNTSYWFTGPLTNPRYGINLPTDAYESSINGATIWPLYRTCGSFHPGGCHALMGDGSIQFFTENTDLSVIAANTTIASGEVVRGIGNNN